MPDLKITFTLHVCIGQITFGNSFLPHVESENQAQVIRHSAARTFTHLAILLTQLTLLNKYFYNVNISQNSSFSTHTYNYIGAQPSVLMFRLSMAVLEAQQQS